MFDEEKLAWVNRHYLKHADPVRLAGLSLPYFREAGVAMAPDILWMGEPFAGPQTLFRSA